MSTTTKSDTSNSEIPVVATVPFTPTSSRAEARKEARAKLTKQRDKINKKSGKQSLSDPLIGQLIRLASNTDASTSVEIYEVLEEYGIDENKITEIRGRLGDANFLASDRGRQPIAATGVQPELQRPRAFEAPPGVPLPVEDMKYWPSRFVMKPDSEDYQEGDLIYSVHEDKSFIVLNELQQTREWQATNHLPPMTLIERVGGGEVKAETAAPHASTKVDKKK